MQKVTHAWLRDATHLRRFCLLDEYCNRGIGSTLLHGLKQEAAAAGKPLRIHVERFTPALRLYERLGFGRRWRRDREKRVATCAATPALTVAEMVI